MRKTFSDLTPKYNSYVFFHTGYLSNWYRSPFVDPKTGVFYNCMEQYMMHRKALLFGDEEVAEMIMKTDDPSVHKRLGREVKGFDVDTWNKEARPIVYEGCYLKFSQNKQLKKMLMGTAGSLLVEASAMDKVWGIGVGMGAFGIDNPQNWRGENWLGQVLTYVREDLASGK
jgi:hypothetical protein